MAEQFYTILTDLGKAKIANAATLDQKVNFTQLALGDGSGSYYNPTSSQTLLVNEVWRGNISKVAVDESNPNWIVIETVVPATEGGFTIREAGVFDLEGNMIAVGKYPETYKPLMAEGSSKDLYVRMILEVSNASVVNLKLDPSVILATKKDIELLTNEITDLAGAGRTTETVKKNADDIAGLSSQMADKTQILTAGGTANAITLPVTLADKSKYSFKATADSTGAVTINTVALKKTDGTAVSNLKVNKVYDIYYDAATSSVFILAKAEGDALVGDVLAGKIFSNGDDVGLVGTFTKYNLDPGNLEILSANATCNISNTIYQKKKSIKVLHDGIIRVSFSTLGYASGGACYAKIYVNDTAVGVERYNNTGGTVYYTEDVVCSNGDEIQLYAYNTTGGVGVQIKTFSIKISEGGLGSIVLNSAS